MKASTLDSMRACNFKIAGGGKKKNAEKPAAAGPGEAEDDSDPIADIKKLCDEEQGI